MSSFGAPRLQVVDLRLKRDRPTPLDLEGLLDRHDQIFELGKALQDLAEREGRSGPISGADSWFSCGPAT
jgi:hypothetical protein